MTFIYLVGTEAGATGFCSFARRVDAADTITAYSTPRGAALAASASDLFIPGFFIGDHSPLSMSTLGGAELVERIGKLGIKKVVEATYNEQYGEAWLYFPRPRSRFAEELEPEALRAFLSLFDRKNDSRAIEQLVVHRIELSE
jgi:hypothetical protein